MNVMSKPHVEETEVPTSLRAQSKLKTRRRVLDAARQLFMERGYEAATIRDIAGHAGLSTGAVFASFVDKTDLFNAVMAEDLHRIIERLRAAERPHDRVEDAVLAVFNVGYEFNADQLPLLRAAVSLSWSQGLAGELGDRPTYGAVLEALMNALRRGVERGELTRDADLRLLAELLWDAYAANYRRALFGEWPLDRLVERMRRQIAVVLGGARVAA